MSASAPGDWLAESASGLRHLRWAREIRGSVDGFSKLLDAEARQAGKLPRVALVAPRSVELAEASAALGQAIDALSLAVKDYRDFLERERTSVRGLERAEAALGIVPHGRLATLDEREREPRRLAVRAAVRSLRETVRETLARFEDEPRLREALLPPLADSQHVADIDDPDDDATRGSAGVEFAPAKVVRERD